MRIIAIVNQKGGSGKTTTSVNVAASLAKEGKKVLLLDLDPQGSASLWFGKKDGKPLYDVFIENKEIDTAITSTSYENLDIVPASNMLAGLEKALAGEVGSEMILKRKILNMDPKSYDYLLIDCPPTLGVLSLNALTAAKEVLIPVEAHVMALQGLVQLLRTINAVQQRLNPALEISGILPCRVDQRTNHSKDIMKQLNSRFKDKVTKSFIRENVRLAEAPLHVKPIIHYDGSSNGANDYMSLAKEIMSKEIKS